MAKIPSIFDDAPETSEAVGKKPDARFELACDLADTHAYLDILIEALRKEQKKVEERLTDIAVRETIGQGLENKERPESFNLRGSKAAVLVTLARRSEQSPVIKDEELTLYRDAGLPLKTKILVHERWAFSDEVMTRILGDDVLRDKVSRAILRALGLKKIDGKNNPLVRQIEQSKIIVTDETVAAAFRTIDDPEVLKKIITTAKMIGFKFVPKFDKDQEPHTIQEAYAVLEPLVAPPPQDVVPVVKSRYVDLESEAAEEIPVKAAQAAVNPPEIVRDPAKKQSRRKRAKADR